MAFPTQQQTQSDALATVVRRAASIKNYAQGARDFFANNTASANQVIAVMTEIRDARDVWNTASTVPGIGQYAKDQFDDPTLDIAAEFTAMVAAAQAVIDWVETNFPKDASGYILKDKIVNGSLEVRQFTPAQSAGFVTMLDNLIATIN